jgi:hypothetical protein
MMTPQPPRDEGDPGLRVSGRARCCGCSGGCTGERVYRLTGDAAKCLAGPPQR